MPKIGFYNLLTQHANVVYHNSKIEREVHRLLREVEKHDPSDSLDCLHIHFRRLRVLIKFPGHEYKGPERRGK